MMTPARSLWVKLSVAFLLVVAVAVGTVAVLTNRATTRQFEIYISQGRQQRAGRLAPDFAAYYARTGSWAGVQEWAGDLSLAAIEEGERGPGSGKGLGRGPGQGSTTSADRIVLVDTDGLVIADSAGDLVGQHVNDEDLYLGAPIAVEGALVGTLIIPAEPSLHQTAETEFLRQANRTLLWAGLIAGVVALAMGLFLARQLTAPLRALTRATQHLAEADLSSSPQDKVPQVEVQTQDEIGQLGQAFNHMATSLAQQQASRRNMMADIAHELRTPLSVIRGDLEALLDGVYEPTPEALGSLQEEAILLSRLVEDLRALAQAEAGQLHLERQAVDMVDLIQGVVASFDLLAESQGQALAFSASSETLRVNADPVRIRQVTANLILNALRHASSHGSRVDVLVGGVPRGVQVSVADDGPGIAPEDVPYVFDRFWRGDRVRANGSGLGLAIARELVRAHGGRIWVESTIGRGTTFSFILPLSSDLTGQR